MAYLPPRPLLTALVGLLTACNAISGVDDCVFDGSGSTTTGAGGAGGAPIVPACGDGVVDLPTGEHCDDGNQQSGDGCAADCTYEPSDGCPTVELHLGQSPVVFMGDTSTASADLIAPCGGFGAPEVVFLIRTAAAGKLEAEMVAGPAGALWVASDCPPGSDSGFVCDDAAPYTIDLDVQPDELIYVVVAGQDGDTGPFQLTLGID